MDFQQMDIWLQSQSLITERECMIVENAIAANQGYAPAYDGDAFIKLMNRFEALRTRLRGS